jgi:hypothetical protein
MAFATRAVVASHPVRKMNVVQWERKSAETNKRPLELLVVTRITLVALDAWFSERYVGRCPEGPPGHPPRHKRTPFGYAPGPPGNMRPTT